MTQEQCSRSSRRCRHVLPPLLIFIGLRVGWYASRTLTACLPYALSLHLHAPPAQAMPRSSSTSNELPEAEREIATTSRACPEIMGSSTRSSAAWTHKGALFVYGARAHPRLFGHACTIRAPHAARGTPTRARTRAHCFPFDRAFCARSIPHASFAPRRSLLGEFLEPDHHPGHFRYFEHRLRALVISVVRGSAAA